MPFLLASWLKLGSLAVVCLAAQVPQSPEVARIQQYVLQVNRNSKLRRIPVSETSAREFIFSPHETDFPCAAILVYAGSKLVKVRETVRTAHDFSVLQYYFENGHLVFVETKSVRCEFGQESPKTKYNEQDYTSHSKYYFSNESILAAEERGDTQFIFTGYDPPVGQQHTPAGFLAWQAARYLAAFPYPPAPKRR